MRPSFTVVCVVCVVLLVSLSGFVLGTDDAERDAGQLIASKGMPMEHHYVHTSDHFVLGMFRIPREGAPVVLLQHGLLDSADTWLVNSREESLAYILYDAGFDVWLGNSRGNKYSRNNTKYSPDWPFDSVFWDFSWDDMARIDMPTQIDYALQVSGKDKLVYMGHSQGTTQAFANLATSDWSVDDKVSLMVALAPVGRVYHTGSLLIKAVADFGIDKIITFLGVREFLPTSALLRFLMPAVCEVTPQLCDSLIYLFCGLDLGDLNKTRMDVYMAHFPSGTSCKDMDHWAQGVRDDSFRMYDYGLTNYFHYHKLSPPTYDPSVIKTPVALFSGGKDDLGDPDDVLWLRDNLGNVVFAKSYPQYGHLDFVWGQSVYKTLYPEVVALANQYS